MTSIQGSIAWRLVPVILSPNFFFRRSRSVGAAHRKQRIRVQGAGEQQILGRQRNFLLPADRRRSACGRGRRAFLADGADPVEIAPPPDVGEADQQHGEKSGDIDDGDPGELPCPFVNDLLGWLSHRRRRSARGRQATAAVVCRNRRIADTQLAIQVIGRRASAPAGFVSDQRATTSKLRSIRFVLCRRPRPRERRTPLRHRR